ncbi:hypothetical protein QYQ98_05755 [Corynebacterium sp. P3-F1]|uniref:IS1096 element passenger TnpR family protein n=1 Tax=Corynebacterium sp. P3-F1 TaxID=3059080 RepID=UPI00265CBC9E|nr:hypothetical protein [Corynebacterium sp. P3-F1]WKK60573.1 hypothetical protein QYQ98_05755 [Corynebacterium sp. P3-F1]
MILTLLMTLEGSRPEISRLVNVEDDVRLDEFAPVIDAAFGFSGAAGHLYMGTADGEPILFSSNPSGGERDETAFTLGDIDSMTYVYDPSANWNIKLDILGVTDIDTPSPLLIDAQGPDVIEPCAGPELMTAFHTEARRLAAGLDPDMKVSPLLLSFMPVMSPERLIQRLSQADHTTVAERIAFTAEQLFTEDAEDFSDDPRAPELTDEFDSFMETRPDLQQILALDPNPERNPTLIAAISEFFSDRAPDVMEDNLYPFTRVVANIRAFIYHCSEPIRLTSGGTLRSPDVRSLADALSLNISPGNHREEAVPALGALRTFLQFADLLESRDGMLCVNEDALDLVTSAEAVLYMFEEEFYRFCEVHQDEDGEQVLTWAANAAGLGIPPAFLAPPKDPSFTVNLLIALGIYEPSSTETAPVLTEPGRGVLAVLLDLD